MTDSAHRLRQLLIARGDCLSNDATLTPLPGGVSSEIYLVKDGSRVFVVKRALPKLKVQQDWLADTSRNYYEQAFIRYVAAFRPDAVPRLLGASRSNGYFCMEFLDGYSNWKTDLLAGRCDTSLAKQAGLLLGEVHARSWSDPRAQRDFDTTENFDQLRIDPYLRATAARHPALAEPLLTEADRLAISRQCLVHGDFSPKNLLHKQARLVMLDCEVAWYGDPAFDLAFLLNHFLLKALYHAPKTLPFDVMVSEARAGYRSANFNAEEVEQRTARLLPMLMLARVDGKSPVEYLADSAKADLVRAFTSERLQQPRLDGLDIFIPAWFDRLRTLRP